jgi:hypothetical protein
MNGLRKPSRIQSKSHPLRFTIYILIVVILFDFGSFFKHKSWAIQLCVGGALIVCIIIGAYRRYHASPTIRFGRSSYRLIAETDLHPKPMHATALAIQIFILSVIKPEEIRQLVVEELEIERQGVLRTVTVDIIIPPKLLGSDGAAQTGPLLLAFEPQEAGTYIDDFTITDQAGHRLRILRPEEYVNLVWTALNVLLRSAYETADNHSLPNDATEAINAAIKQVAKPRIGVNKFEVADRLENLGAPNDVQTKLAAQLVRVLSSFAPSIVEVSTDDTYKITLNHSQLASYRLFLGSSPGQRLTGLFFASGPTNVTVGLSNCRTTQEYRLWVRVPDGYYFVGQTLLPTASADVAQVRWRTRRRHGLPYAFFSMSGGPNLPPSSPEWSLRLSFAEVPPGKSLSATIAALSCAILMWFIGITVSHTSKGIGTDVPALLLAFPAVAAGWLSFDRPSKRLSEGPLIVQCSLLFTLVLSLIAAGLFMLSQIRFIILRPDTFGGLRFLWVSQPVWILVLLLALLNAVIITRVCVRDAYRYVRILEDRYGP